MISVSTALFIAVICCGIAGAVVGRKLTLFAALTGALLATFIFIGTGWPGFALMTTFFFLGTLATSWKKATKQNLLGSHESGERTAGQVLANAGVGGLAGLLAIAFPSYQYLFFLLMAGAFSSATADTVSSELGVVYGTICYDILSFKKGQRGADGVISVEGILFGIAGSSCIAGIQAFVYQPGIITVWIIIAGTIGNLADSYLGATLERRSFIGNNAVNFLNTVIAALVMLLAYFI